MKYITIYDKETNEVIAQIQEDENGNVKAIQDDNYSIIVDGYMLIEEKEVVDTYNETEIKYEEWIKNSFE